MRSRYYYQRKRDKKYIPTLVWCDSNWKLFSFRFFQSIIGFCKNKIGSFHFNLSSKWVYGERGFLATCNAFAAFAIQTWLSLFFCAVVPVTAQSGDIFEWLCLEPPLPSDCICSYIVDPYSALVQVYSTNLLEGQGNLNSFSVMLMQIIYLQTKYRNFRNM